MGKYKWKVNFVNGKSVIVVNDINDPREFIREIKLSSVTANASTWSCDDGSSIAIFSDQVTHVQWNLKSE